MSRLCWSSDRLRAVTSSVRPLTRTRRPDGVEFGLCRFLEPDLPAVGVLEAEGDGIGRAFRVDAAHERLEPLAVVRIDAREKVCSR